MYEAESNYLIVKDLDLPAEVIEKFRSFRDNVIARTLLPWSEHCTECVWPTCYSTCDLYSPREDGRCRRFVDGMVRMDCAGSVNSYLIKVRFKRWGKLWTPGNVRLFPLRLADKLERRDQRIASIIRELPIPERASKFATLKRYSWKKRIAARRKPSSENANIFVIECYNPGHEAISLSLTMRSSISDQHVPFQKLVSVSPGFQSEEIPVEDIGRVLDLRVPFNVELIPNDIADDTPMYFGLIDFVKSRQPAAVAGTAKTSQIKCLVWDLDNTLWSGVLVEDGADKLVLKAGIVDIIKESDRRGVLHSIASKNSFDETMLVLKRFALDGYFLHPQISWAPKSEALNAIAHKLNIGIDTLMLIDDSEFELAQVRSACPRAQVFHADGYLELPNLPIFQVPVTEESANRRKMYQQEAIRESVAEGYSGDYHAFLRECRIEMNIESLSLENLGRVHELTQRTNQMNFSGNRYQRQLLEQIAATQHLDTYVINCRDRFGSYGIVGFSIVDSREPRMTDLMFSCRIQAKRVEHAFLAYLIKKYTVATGSDFWASYRKTPRNAPSGRVFKDIGMEEFSESDGVTSLVFHREREVPDDAIVHVVES